LSPHALSGLTQSLTGTIARYPINCQTPFCWLGEKPAEFYFATRIISGSKDRGRRGRRDAQLIAIPLDATRTSS
jgi:hypothetical protein